MITRGVLIGRIIDDLAKLIWQVKLRNKVGLLDLTKFCEDFFKEFLNLIYDTCLRNLNSTRSNEPGIDLGDSTNRIAYQITSTKTSKKINDTLRNITSGQKGEYDVFKVLIVGIKQSTYSLKPELKQDISFEEDKNIIDINDIVKEISILDIDKLEALNKLFQREFRSLIIELQPMDESGDFDGSLYRVVEVIPNRPPTNSNKLTQYYESEIPIADIISLYNRIAQIPKLQREYISLIAERGESGESGVHQGYWIHCTKLASILKQSEKNLFNELAYLEDEGIIVMIDDVDSYDRPNNKYGICDPSLNTIIAYLKEHNMDIRKLIVTMNFKDIEEE